MDLQSDNVHTHWAWSSKKLNKNSPENPKVLGESYDLQDDGYMLGISEQEIHENYLEKGKKNPILWTKMDF